MDYKIIQLGVKQLDLLVNEDRTLVLGVGEDYYVLSFSKLDKNNSNLFLRLIANNLITTSEQSFHSNFSLKTKYSPQVLNTVLSCKRLILTVLMLAFPIPNISNIKLLNTLAELIRIGNSNSRAITKFEYLFPEYVSLVDL
jgi:ABC-type antimicrobial peptide transport system permease subunit